MKFKEAEEEKLMNCTYSWIFKLLESIINNQYISKRTSTFPNNFIYGIFFSINLSEKNNSEWEPANSSKKFYYTIEYLTTSVRFGKLIKENNK